MVEQGFIKQVSQEDDVEEKMFVVKAASCMQKAFGSSNVRIVG